MKTMFKHRNLMQLAVLTMMSMGLIVSCSKDEAPEPDKSNVINLSGDNGYLVDGNNQTLYIFSNDVSGANKCSGGCADIWPLYYTDNLSLGAGLDAADFGEITLSDQSKQITFKGWPLYYYSPTGDGTLEARGATSGEAVNGVWFVAKEYSLMLANAQLVGHDGKNYISDYTVGDGKTKYFTDGEGNTVYTFKNDTKDTNNFTASDFSNDGVWPIFYKDIKDLPSTLSATDFGVIDVYGKMQLTYRGWPLYYFGQDQTRGDNKGVSFPAPGVWPIANADTQNAQ